MATRPRLSAERSQQLTRLLTITKTASVRALMDACELARLVAQVAVDIGLEQDMAQAFPALWPALVPPRRDYYDTPLHWFATPDARITVFDVVDLMDRGAALDPDFMTYLRCLAELHKRRRKYGMILQRQPLPTMVQVSPRALMEYGTDFPPEALASWLTWRKFFYDLDNRCAQETGYLFEPILAAAIGGEPKSARERVVCRAEDRTKGRQVDCWKVLPDGTALAYELKLRVTIAASGQGRFGEELSFARDCRMSGARPILVVLDPTENSKLSELQAAYRQEGGMAYVGEAAWEHLQQEAGETMAAFIERYVYAPVAAVSRHEQAVAGQASRRALVLQGLQARLEGSELVLALGAHERRIERCEDESLATDEDASGETG